MKISTLIRSKSSRDNIDQSVWNIVRAVVHYTETGLIANHLNSGVDQLLWGDVWHGVKCTVDEYE